MRLRLRAGFTLIELLVVTGIVAFLSAAVVLVLNPMELIRQARDSTRLTDLSGINKSLQLYQLDVPGGSFGSSSVVYVSIPDSSPACANLGLPPLSPSYSYGCAPSSTYQKTDSTGWIPVNLNAITAGAPLSSLPVDPINTTSSGYYYTYISGSWALTAKVESQKYIAQLNNSTGTGTSNNPDRYQVGTDLALTPPLSSSSSVSVAVSSISPNSGTNNGSVGIGTIFGQGFLSGATVQLIKSGQVAITGIGFSVLNGTTINGGSFNLNGSATGTWNVYVLNTNNTSGTFSNGFTVNAPLGPPTVSSSSPSSRGQGATSQSITVTGTNFVSPATTTFSSTGITVNSMSVITTSQISANIGVASSATTGARNIIVTTTNGSGTCSLCFTVNAAPTVTSASPASSTQGSTGVSVTITGTAFVSGATASFSGTGITVTTTTFGGATQLTAVIDIIGGAATGARDITVANPDGGVGVKTAAFTVNAPPSTFTQKDYRLYQNADSVQPGAALALENVSSTITATSSPIRIRMNLTVGGQTLATSSQAFKVQFATAISGPWTDMGALASTTAWKFYNNPTPANGEFITTALLVASDVKEYYEESNPTWTNQATIPAGQEGEWDFPVNPANAANNTTYYFRLAKDTGAALDGYTTYPTVGVNVAALPPLTLTQRDYRLYANADSVQPGAALAVENVSSTITATSSPIRIRMNLTVGGQTLATSSQAFKVQFATAISGPWTDVGALASTTAWKFYNNPTPLNGAFITTALLAASDVKEYYEESNPTWTNQAAIPAGQEGEWDFPVNPANAANNTTYYFRLAKDTGAALDGYTNYARVTVSVTNPPPNPTSASPTSSPQGATSANITITGSNFTNPATTTFSGTGITVNSTNFVSASQLTANITVAVGATVGTRNITVTTTNGSGTCSLCFTVNAAPTVTLASPASSTQGSIGVSVTITGTAFVSGATASFSGTGVTVSSTAFVSATQLNSVVNISAGAATGTRNITVVNPDGGIGTGIGLFTVNAGTGSGPVGWWKFDDGAGTTAADSSGNLNTGTLTNGPVWTTGTVGTGALNFDGVDDLVNVGSPAVFDDMASMSLSVWAKANTHGEGSQGFLLSKNGDFSGTGWNFQTTVTGNTVVFSVPHSTTSLYVEASANSSNFAVWNYWVVTWDGSTSASNVHIYKNGVETAYGTQTNAVGSRSTDAANSIIVGNSAGAVRTWDGPIDDVRVYNRALTVAEVSTLYAMGDTTPPSTPTGLTATAISSAQINLSWTASTDNVAVTGYKVYRCSGVACVPTVLFATLGNVTTYPNTGLTAGTAYGYKVSAIDAAGNESILSATASATTPAAISFVQSATTTPTYDGSVVTSTKAFSSNTTAGNMIIVVAGSNAMAAGTISDTAGNTFTLATSTLCTGAPCGFANLSQHIYYATNIVGGADTVNFRWTSAPGWNSVAIFEYSGLATSNSLDQVNSAIGGNAITSLNTGTSTTTSANELLFTAVSTYSSCTSTPTVSAGWTNKVNTYSSSASHCIVTADRIVSATGSYSNTFGGFPANSMAAAIVTFK